jgi:hypothetical protein
MMQTSLQGRAATPPANSNLLQCNYHLFSLLLHQQRDCQGTPTAVEQLQAMDIATTAHKQAQRRHLAGLATNASRHHSNAPHTTQCPQPTSDKLVAAAAGEAPQMPADQPTFATQHVTYC